MSVEHLPNGDLDTHALERFLDNAIGPNQWLMTTDWLFTGPPDEREHGQTVPVIVPEDVAVRLILTDLEGPNRRVVRDHPVVGVEARRWRWISGQQAPKPQGQSRFPWEVSHA